MLKKLSTSKFNKKPKQTLFRIMMKIRLMKAAVEAAITPIIDISMLEDVDMDAYTAIL